MNQRSKKSSVKYFNFVSAQIEFNQWLNNEGPKVEPPIQLIDTTGVEVGETVKHVAAWIRNNLACIKKDK